MSDDVRKRSVTRDDNAGDAAAGRLSIVIGPAQWAGLLDGVRGATGLPRYGSMMRDRILAESPMIEDMWASAVGLAITKQSSLGWRIEDDAQSQRRIHAAQRMLLAFDGDYVAGITRHLRDYLLTNNGAFVEIVRASTARGSRIIGLMQLDSLRCHRIDDPAYPVLYEDRRGAFHRLPAENVIAFADLPSARIEHAGMGHCAADRVWSTILKRAAVETYFREKVSGARNLAIHFVTNVNAERLREALHAEGRDLAGRGYVLYRGATIIPMLSGGGAETPTVITIPLAEIPDGFDPEQERRAANQIYANALGIPVQDIQPLSGQGLGTGTQTIILDEAAQGHGLAAWRRSWQQAMTHRVLPTTTTFYFDSNDLRDRQQRAQILASVAGAVGPLVQQGVLRPDQALNVLVDEGVIDPAYLPSDQTPGALLSDLDKPVDAEEPEPTTLIETPKARREPADLPELADADVDALIDAELAAGLAWARLVAGASNEQ